MAKINTKNINNVFVDYDDLVNKIVEGKGKYSKAGRCMGAAFDFFIDQHQGTFENGARFHRDSISDDIVSRYDKPSRGLYDTGERAKNKSLDSWEYGDAMTGEGQGKYLYVRDSKEQYAKDNGVDIDTGRGIPLGAVVLTGTTNPYTGDNKDPRHTMVVTGFDKNTGEPLLFSNANGASIVRWRDFVRDYKPLINRIVGLNDYDGFTYDNLKNIKEGAQRDYGYKGKLYSTSRYVNNMLDFDEYQKNGITNVNIKNGIGSDMSDKLMKASVGILAQETGIGDNIDLTDSMLESNGLKRMGSMAALKTFLDRRVDAANSMKGLAKAGKTVVNKAVNTMEDAYDSLVSSEETLDDKIRKHDTLRKAYPNEYELEMAVYDTVRRQNPGLSEEKTREITGRALDKIKRENYYSIKRLDDRKKGLSDLYDELTSKPSVGTGQIKSLPQSYIENFYRRGFRGRRETEPVTGIARSDKSLSQNGALATYSYLAEETKKLREQYPDLNDDEITQLAISSYNNGSKKKDRRFVDFYIKDKKMKDDYINKVQKWQNAMFNVDDKTLDSMKYENGGGSKHVP